MSHAARAFRLELLQLYRSVPSSRVFSHIFRVRVPPERSPIYRNVPPFSSLTPRTIVGSHQTSEENGSSCLIGKSEGIPMVDTTIGAAGVIQPAEVKDVELYHPKSWVTKYVFCQDAKVIAIQY